MCFTARTAISAHVLSRRTFSSSFATYSSAAADDFVIPAGHKWKITDVDVTGEYYNGSGPASSEIVSFYTDRKGYPDKAKAAFTLNCTDNRGSFACKLPGNGQSLSGGTVGRRYWVSVVANCDFIACGEWGWVQNTKIRHYEGVWENPQNGYRTGCTPGAGTRRAFSCQVIMRSISKAKKG